MPDPANRDAAALRVHRLDQAGAALANVAHLVAQYRRALIADGVPAREATRLATGMQRLLLELADTPPPLG